MMNKTGANHIDVVAGLIVQKGLLLACRRHETTVFPLKWEFPGGKVESGEGCEDASTRDQRRIGDRNSRPGEIFNHRHFYPGHSKSTLIFFA
jgi:8-oxo-dGTP diphosphatase